MNYNFIIHLSRYIEKSIYSIFRYFCKTQNMSQLKPLLLFSLILSSFFIQAQETDTLNIAFIAYWEVGDSYDFKITNYSMEWKHEELTKNDSIEHFANFKVIDSTETTYKIEWTLKNGMTNVSKAINDQLKLLKIDKKYSLYNTEEVKVIYETTEFGDFLHILNWEELAERATQEMDEVLKQTELFKRLRLIELLSPYQEIFSTQEGVEQLLMPELQIFHYLLGSEFNPMEEFEFEQEYPGLVSENTLTAESVISFEEVDYENYFCVLKEESFLNQESVADHLDIMMKKMKIPEDEVDEIVAYAEYDIYDLSYYNFFYYPGVPHSIYNRRVAHMVFMEEDVTRVEELIIELIFEDEEKIDED